MAAILDGAMGDGHMPSFEVSCNVLPYWTVEVAGASTWAEAEDGGDGDEEEAGGDEAEEEAGGGE